jgi:hypothetical protein
MQEFIRRLLATFGTGIHREEVNDQVVMDAVRFTSRKIKTLRLKKEK